MTKPGWVLDATGLSVAIGSDLAGGSDGSRVREHSCGQVGVRPSISATQVEGQVPPRPRTTKVGAREVLKCLIFVASVSLAPSGATAHPAHAEPVNYPYVVGFERFHSGLDDDDHLAAGGFILLDELNCVACHEPPAHLAAELPGVESTRLEGVASRLSSVDLELMIRNPRFLKQDTTMPGFFSGRDRDPAEIEALKHYLAGFVEDPPDYPEGDVEAGRVLYHRIGCAACHAPELGYVPPGLPPEFEIELAGLPSVPMNLADRYSLDSLVHFLLHPHEHRPSGRMPDFRLSESEACDLAAYLKAGPDLVLPENVLEALGGAAFEVDEALAARGKSLFASKNCTACHQMPEANGRTVGRATPLDQLSIAERNGCLSERPVGGGLPYYGLDEVQKRAIVAALERLGSRIPQEPALELDQRMKRLNCYACHERGGVGGAETAREVYFGFRSQAAVSLGRVGHLPPPLDGVEGKLTAERMRQVLHGSPGAMVRPWLEVRMPSFQQEDVEPLVGLFSQLDLSEGDRPVPSGSAEKGESLFRKERWGENRCVDCHDPDGSREIPGPDLGAAPERLRWVWFESLGKESASFLPSFPRAHEYSTDEAADLWRYLGSNE